MLRSTTCSYTISRISALGDRHLRGAPRGRARDDRADGGEQLRDRKLLRTRRVVTSFWQNFSKMLLVFGCIKTKFCKKIIFKICV